MQYFTVCQNARCILANTPFWQTPSEFFAVCREFHRNPLTAVDDFADGTSFNSITIAGSGYTLVGSAMTLINGIAASYTSGTSFDKLDTTLNGTQTISVASGGTLELKGALPGTGVSDSNT